MTDTTERLWSEAEIVAFCAHPDPGVRLWALTQLGRFTPERSAPQAIAMLRDGNGAVQHRALSILSSILSPQLLAELSPLAEDPGLPGPIRAKLQRLITDRPPRDERRAHGKLPSDPGRLRREATEALAGEPSERRSAALEALGWAPYRWVVPLVLERIDALLASSDDEAAWDVIDHLGDPVALDAVIDAWRPGERKLAGLAHRLHQLSGRASPLGDDLLRDAEAWRASRDEFLGSGHHEGQPMGRGKPMWLSLRCQRCQRAHAYEIPAAFLHPSYKERTGDEPWDGIVLSRVITCKRCGAVDDYRLTPSAQLTLMGAMFASALDPDASGPRKTPRGATVAELRLPDGTLVERPSAAIARLTAAAEAAPADGAGWRRLGNFLERLGDADGAVASWERAIREDPGEIESCYSLAEARIAARDLDGATRFLGAGLAALARNSSHGQQRSDLVGGLLGLVATLLGDPRRKLFAELHWDAGQHRGVVDLRQIEFQQLHAFLTSPSFSRAALVETPAHDDEALQAITRAALRARVPVSTPEGTTKKIGRNDPCPCGSGKKYKKCCGA